MGNRFPSLQVFEIIQLEIFCIWQEANLKTGSQVLQWSMRAAMKFNGILYCSERETEALYLYLVSTFLGLLYCSERETEALYWYLVSTFLNILYCSERETEALYLYLVSTFLNILYCSERET